MKMTTYPPCHHQILHLQAPRDHHFYENYVDGVSYVFFAGFQDLIQNQMHAT